MSQFVELTVSNLSHRLTALQTEMERELLRLLEADQFDSDTELDDRQHRSAVFLTFCEQACGELQRLGHVIDIVEEDWDIEFSRVAVSCASSRDKPCGLAIDFSPTQVRVTWSERAES